jgi:hypothetical protein
MTDTPLDRQIKRYHPDAGLSPEPGDTAEELRQKRARALEYKTGITGLAAFAYGLFVRLDALEAEVKALKATTPEHPDVPDDTHSCNAG